MKKKVPDWLNSSLWASSRPPTSPPAPAVAVDPLVPVTPPEIKPSKPPASSSVVVCPSKAETRDPLNSWSNSSSYDAEIKCDGSSISTDTPSASAHDAAEPRDAEEISRQSQIVQELSKKVINMDELRKLASQGIPGGDGIRATVWKLLLGYLPVDRSRWSSELTKKRSQYKHFKDELLMNPSDITRKLEKAISENPPDGAQGFLSRSEISHGEHPLCLGQTSVWNQFFKDAEIIEQIERDVLRTHPDIIFFSGNSPSAKLHQEALKNILIVFAKLNPGIRYVQGMNEILAPLFFVFKNDPDAENAAYAEADSFFCFVELLSSFRDNFVQQLDNSVVGIRATISRLSKLLKEHDEELWRHLEITTKVNPQFYAFSDPDGPQETLLRVCCAMLIFVRRRLLAGDFTSNLKLLQHYPSANIGHLLYVANKLRSAS